MRAVEHWDKAARLEASKNKGLSDIDDYELIIWSCIQGGGHLANVILHCHGITAEDQDQLHSDNPKLKQELPEELAQIFAVLKSIENLGARFVRGNEPMTPEIVKTCVTCYEKVKSFAKTSLQARKT